jgi:hypothetical protein
MVGRATSPGVRVGRGWDRLRTSIGTDHTAGAGRRRSGPSLTGEGSVLVSVSVGGSCPHEADQETGTHDGDRQDEEFHDEFPFLPPEGEPSTTVTPGACVAP